MTVEYKIYVHSETGKIEVFKRSWNIGSYDKIDLGQFKEELRKYGFA